MEVRRLVLHLQSLSVNRTVYLSYDFMATSEPQKYVINKIPVFRYYFNLLKALPRVCMENTA